MYVKKFYKERKCGMETIDIVKEKLSIFKNLYDSIRVVDPINKKVIEIKGDKAEDVQGTCYGLWKKNQYCRNCISMRAYVENDTLLKMEFTEGKVMIITASPVTIEGNVYVVEMIKAVPKSGYIMNNEKDTDNVQSLLNQMNDAAIKDELTGIYNRRYINENLPIEMNNSRVYNQPLCVIMADLDFFKYVNDNHGHVVGDWVLKDFAKILSTSIRSSSDWVSRYGGEEFLIVLRNTDAHNGFKVAEKIRKLVEEKGFVYGDINIKITASFGVYSIIARDVNLSVDELINEADKNLYLAKNSGRNKTVINSESNWSCE